MKIRVANWLMLPDWQKQYLLEVAAEMNHMTLISNGLKIKEEK